MEIFLRSIGGQTEAVWSIELRSEIQQLKRLIHVDRHLGATFEVPNAPLPPEGHVTITWSFRGVDGQEYSGVCESGVHQPIFLVNCLMVPHLCGQAFGDALGEPYKMCGQEISFVTPLGDQDGQDGIVIARCLIVSDAAFEAMKRICTSMARRGF